jgi:hypothetical protein
MSEDMSVAENTESSAEESGSLLSPTVGQEETPESPEEMSVPHLEGEPEATGDDEIDWGDKPEWMPDQFWDPKDGPDLESMAKSYQELRAKMSAGKHKAPKDGAYDIASLKDHGVSDDDPLLSDFKGFAAENGLSQEQFDQVTQIYMQHMGEMMDNIETSREAEIAKLGPRGEKVIKWFKPVANQAGQFRCIVIRRSGCPSLSNGSSRPSQGAAEDPRKLWRAFDSRRDGPRRHWLFQRRAAVDDGRPALRQGHGIHQ